MRYCYCCKVTIADNAPRCPLCDGELADAGDSGAAGASSPVTAVNSRNSGESVFPIAPPVVPPSKRLITFIGFGTVVAAVFAVAVNIAVTPGHVWWSLFVISGLCSLWLCFLVSNKRWWNIPKNIFLQLMVLSVLEIAWDFFTGFNKWSINFVIPIMFTCSMIALFVFAKVRKLNAGDYILFLVIISILSIFSLLLIIFNAVTVIYPALICFTFSVISTAFILLFEGKSLLEELKRRMHL